MYKLQDWVAVQRVYKQTQSQREIARILVMSRNTVRKLLAQKEKPVLIKLFCNALFDQFNLYILPQKALISHCMNGA